MTQSTKTLSNLYMCLHLHFTIHGPLVKRFACCKNQFTAFQLKDKGGQVPLEESKKSL